MIVLRCLDCSGTGDLSDYVVVQGPRAFAADRQPTPRKPCTRCSGTGWVRDEDQPADYHAAVGTIGVLCPRCKRMSHLSHPIRWWETIGCYIGQCEHGCGDTLAVPLRAVELMADYATE